MTMAARADACNSDPNADTSMLDPLPIRVDRMQIVDSVPLEESVYNIAQMLMVGPICQKEEADSKQPARIDQASIDATLGTGTTEQSMTSYPPHGGNNNSYSFPTAMWPDQAYSSSHQLHRQVLPPDANYSLGNNIGSSMGFPNEESSIFSDIASSRGLPSLQVPHVFNNNNIMHEEQYNNTHRHDHFHHHHHNHFGGNYHTQAPTINRTTANNVTAHTNDEVVGMRYPESLHEAAMGRQEEPSIADYLSLKQTQNDNAAASYMQFRSTFSEQNDSYHPVPSKPAAKRNPESNRSHTKNSWDERFKELKRYRQKFGHCDIESKDYPSLSHWVKRQRYQYKLQPGRRQTNHQQQRQLNLTAERIEALNRLGFIWDSHRATWEKRYHELAEYKQLNGDCNVPTEYAGNPALGVWLKGQRRQHNLFRVGRKSTITIERIQRLEELGLQWYLRPPKMTAAKDKDDEL